MSDAGAVLMETSSDACHMLAVFVLLPTGFRNISGGAGAAAVVPPMLFALGAIVTQRLTTFMRVRTLPLAR